MEDESVRDFGKDVHGAKACEAWTDITVIDACGQYVMGLKNQWRCCDGRKMESRDCHPGFQVWAVMKRPMCIF